MFGSYSLAETKLTLEEPTEYRSSIVYLEEDDCD